METVPLSLAVVVTDPPHGHLEVGGCLVLELVRQGVDLEPVQSEEREELGYTGMPFTCHQKVGNYICLLQGTHSNSVFKFPVFSLSNRKFSLCKCT